MNSQRDKIFELLRSRNVEEMRLALAMMPADPSEIITMLHLTEFLAPVMHYFFRIYAYENHADKRHVWQLMIEDGNTTAYRWRSEGIVRKETPGFDDADRDAFSCRNTFKRQNLLAYDPY